MKRMMKRTLTSLLVCLVVGVLFAACGDDFWIWDFGPVQFAITASENGSDRLSPESEENWEFMEQITITYKGEEYRVSNRNEFAGGSTRAYLAIWRGLRLGKLSEVEFDATNPPYALIFGEFDGADDYNEMTFTVNWPDGKQDEVKYWRTVTGKDKKHPSVKEKILINGKKTDKPIIHREY